MAGALTPQTGNIGNVAAGSKLYHWRYGPLSVVRIAESTIRLELDDRDGVVDVLEDPWASDTPPRPRRFPHDALGQWLFETPEDVGRTVGLSTGAVSPGDFEYRLHKSFDPAVVLKNSPVHQLRAAQRDLTSARDRLQALATTLGILHSQLEGLQVTMADLQQRRGSASARITQLTDDRDELKQEQTPAILKEKQPRIAQLDQEIQQAQEEQGLLDVDIREHRKKVEDLQQELARSSQDKSVAEDEVATLESEIRDLEKALSELR